LLSVTSWANTVSVGAFPPLLLEIGRTQALSDWELGTLAGVFGLARALADGPVGVFVARRLRLALLAAPLTALVGVVCLVGATTFPMLLLGRGLLGVGHAAGIMAGLTAILRVSSRRRIGAGLNAFEFGGMLGVLCGIAAVRLLPLTLSWRAVVLLTAAPHLMALVVLAPLLNTMTVAERGVERAERPVAARALARESAGPLIAVLLAAVLIAMTWSAATQFIIPLRGTREFDLDRAGVAQLLMLAQLTDAVCLLPFGILADRIDGRRLLGGVLLLFALASVLVSFATLTFVTGGCVLLGVAIAGWMLPLAIIRRMSTTGLARRTTLYRIAGDSGMFLGPFIPGLLGEALMGVMAGANALLLALVAAWLVHQAAIHPTPTRADAR